ncbi:putative aminophospholipid-translocase [Hanseniaspora osmophila]
MSFSQPGGRTFINHSRTNSSFQNSNDFTLEQDSLEQALDSIQFNNGINISGSHSEATSKDDFELASLPEQEIQDHQTTFSDPLLSNKDSKQTAFDSPTKDNRETQHFKNLQTHKTNIIDWLFDIRENFGNRKKQAMSIKLDENNVEREIRVNTTPVFDRKKYPSNQLSNAKYNPVTFIPLILYEQFKFFFNLYFLLVALSQAIPQLRIGYLSSYIVPLAFVLLVTMSKEAMDDIQRRRRDAESNNELYEALNQSKLIPSKDLKVGDLVQLKKGQRIPTDMVLLQSTSDTPGECFIKTDQLDGETDWKLRLACPLTQKCTVDDLINKASITAEAPQKNIHSFNGKLTLNDVTSVPLTCDNTLWANTVLASSGSCIGCVIYTGIDTRQAMNTTKPKAKTGLLELEVNSISKILCLSVFILSVLLVLLSYFSSGDNADESYWYVDVMRYLILFSTIIPVSLRVNLDLGKSVYGYQIEHDATIANTIVRTSTIPEDLGRIEYLLSDKTGTLTQNDMELKKLHLGSIAYTQESFDMIKDQVAEFNTATGGKSLTKSKDPSRKSMSHKVYEMIVTLALCHNVTPTFEESGELSYQAASPDEIAIVKFTEEVGLSLFKRDKDCITLFHEASKTYLNFKILYVFPFNSNTKRMGIVVKQENTSPSGSESEEYLFLEKGADSIMSKIVLANDWLEEETGNMAREGLRTLVIGRKKLNQKNFELFKKEYEKASISMINRDETMLNCIKTHLEHGLELLGLTGVEDKLQKNVKSSIELLRNAGVKIWMLTGDKVETAKCVAISAKLISRGQYVHTITGQKYETTSSQGLDKLEVIKSNASNSVLLIDGESLGMYLEHYKEEFFHAVIDLPAVVACRCTPQQKADVAHLIRQFTGKRVCCIGDGGNDVSMIQAADVGIGIVGKEGKQASLAADFSIEQFCYLTTLLLWHGRNSYKRSAKLAQFVIHRGLIISICQALYSICSGFEPLALYQGWLMVGYSTFYTMAPVFSLTTDYDIDESLSMLYPELYKELTEGKSLSYKSFFAWCALSLYQGVVIQGFSQHFTSLKDIDFTKMVAISFTVLIFNELIMVALEIRTWNKMMFLSEIVTFLLYVVSVPFLSEYFNLEYVLSLTFFVEMIFILSVSILPVWMIRALYRRLHLPSYAKVQQFSV